MCVRVPYAVLEFTFVNIRSEANARDVMREIWKIVGNISSLKDAPRLASIRLHVLDMVVCRSEAG